MNQIKNIIARINKNPKQMIAVSSIALLLVMLIYLNFSLRPQLSSLISTVDGLNRVSADLRGAESDISRIENMKGEIESYSAKLGQYENTLPTKDSIPALLESLAAIANSSDMRIVGIIPIDKKMPSMEGRAYREMPIMITAKAGYHELGRFLSELEQSGRFMKVADIKIKSDKANPKKHDVELIVVTYVLLEGK